MKGVIVGAVGMLLLLVLIALGVILTGGYNVAATDRHNPIIGWALSNTMENSVRNRASDGPAPPEFTLAMVKAGAGEYKAMCAHCHGGVGKAAPNGPGPCGPSPLPLPMRPPNGARAKSSGWSGTA